MITGNFLFNLIIYVFINFLIFLSWYHISKKITSFKFGERIAASFIFTITQIILSELILGVVIKQLYPLQLFIFNIILCIILGIIFKFPFKEYIRDSKNIFHRIKVKDAFKRKNWVADVIFVLTVFVILNLLVLIFVYGPLSWDDYHYHLGFVADIIQSGEIRNFPYTHLYTISFPHDIELLNLWNVIFFRNDGGVEITNLFFLLFTSLIIYLTCRKFSVNKRISLIGALLVFYIPMNLVLVKTTKVDMDVAALFIGAMYFLITLNFKKINSRTNKFRIILSSICMGIVLGAKSSSAYYLFAYIITLLVLVLYSYRLKNWKKILKFLFFNYLTLFFGCLILGSFWYFRSWIVFGNPLYPLDFKVFGIHFPGEWQNVDFSDGLPQIQQKNYFSRLLYVWREKESWFGVYYLGDGKLGGFGSLWYILLLPSIIFATIFAFIKKNWKLLFYIAGIGICFATIPGNWVPHYSTIITLLGCVTFTIFFFHNIKNVILKSLFTILILFLLGINAILTLNGGYLDFKETYRRVKDPNANDFPHTQMFKDSNMLINEILDNGDTVVIGSNIYFPYALIKDNFATKETMIPYKDESNWLTNLKQVDPRLVMTLQDTPEYKTALSHPDLFEKVLVEDVGPHYLFAYLGNPKNKKIEDKVIEDKKYDNDSTKQISIKEIRVDEKFGINNFDISFYVNDASVINKPRIFFHVLKNNDFYNLDFDPQEITNNEIQGTSQVPIIYGDKYQVQMGLLDKNIYIPFTVNINE